MNEVLINGIAYPKNHPGITVDYISGEYILKNNGFNISTALRLDVIGGYDGSLTTKVVNSRKINTYINEGLLKVLITRHGDIYITPKVEIIGDGILFNSIDEDNQTFVYDNWSNIRHNIPNKFRTFDNIVKKFKDVDNILIPDKDRKMLIERNFQYGVESVSYKILGGYDYTFGVELETSSGRLSESDVKGLNLRCEFDGSLRENPDQRREDVLGKRKKS